VHTDHLVVDQVVAVVVEEDHNLLVGEVDILEIVDIETGEVCRTVDLHTVDNQTMEEHLQVHFYYLLPEHPDFPVGDKVQPDCNYNSVDSVGEDNRQEY
jgi:hypothetical protein